MATFYKGDCQQLIKRLSDKSIDLIYFDPPFNTTQNAWDEPLKWSELFDEFFRVLKDTGTLVIHCSVPFNYELIRAAPRPPTYSWYWLKEGPTCPFIAKVQPLRNTEEILVWKMKKTTYYPQRVGDKERFVTSNGVSPYYGGISDSKPNTRQKVKGYYQTHHLTFKRPPTHGKNAKNGFGTRPIELIDLIIRSYTKEGDLILDPTCHLGICGKVAKDLKRRWIGFDKYFMPKFLLEPTRT